MKISLRQAVFFVICALAGTITARDGVDAPVAPAQTCFDGWSATSTTNTPVGKAYHTAVWTGSEMIVWGGSPTTTFTPDLGRIYHPDTDSWTAVSGTNSPTGRIQHTAVWTGSEMIIWGGHTGHSLNDGGRYNPVADTWVATSTTNAPSARDSQGVVWTGSEMIVWGGYSGGSALNSGGRYNPGTDTWTTMSAINAPSGRYFHAAVWTGSEMIVWGGFNGTSESGTGGRYNPATDTWTTTSNANAPANRSSLGAVWTGSEMIVWGGYGGSHMNSGGKYNPDTDTWTTTSLTGAPSPRSYPTAIWTGSEMIPWGGYDATSYFNAGGRYNPSTNSWAATTILNAPSSRANHTAVWTGSQMIVWGGFNLEGDTNTGGRYCGQPSPTPGTLGNISTRLRVLSGDNVLIGGMIATGTATKRVIVRAIGPSLTGLGVPGALADTTLELYQGNTLLSSNDDWQTSSQQAEIASSGFAPSNSLESAIIWTLTPNQGYTAIVRGKNGTTGVGVVEAYDLDQAAASKLGNISTRGFVDVDDNVMIAGLIVGPGNGTSAKILARVLGPTLSDLGVPGALADPTLDLVNASGTVIRACNNWQDDPAQRSAIIAAGLAPNHDEEAALVETVSPGAYTAIVRGNNRTTGVGLVEVYQIP